MDNKRHDQHTESHTPKPILTHERAAQESAAAEAADAKEQDAAKAKPKTYTGPLLGALVHYRDSNGIVSAAHVTGHSADGSLFLHILYRDGVAGSHHRSGITESKDGGEGWMAPSKGGEEEAASR